LKHAEKRVIYHIIISEEVITSEDVRERIRKTMSKTYESQEQTRKRKQSRKKKRLFILNN